MPIMLGWKLWKLGWLSGAELKTYYGKMLKPAADFLVKGGKVDLGWNHSTITPPFTQQERWEEQGGYSPSTTAAVIAGLVVAGDIAEAAGDKASADIYRKTADDYSSKVEARMVTTKGAFGDGHYYLRLNSDQDADNKSPVEERNGQAAVPEDKMLDAGFLELVRYGVRRADDPAIVASLPKIDDESLEDLYRVRYSFKFPGVDGTFPGFRRYGVDGYGEDTKTGANYGPTVRCVRASVAGCGRSSPASAATTSWLWPVSRASPTRRRSRRSATPMSRPWSSSPMKAC
jgi:glucoamylase